VTNPDQATTKGGPPPDQAATRYVGVTEASRLLGLHPDAIRSRLRRRAIGCKRGNDGHWLIEVPAVVDQAVTTPEVGHDPAMTELRLELDELRTQLTDARVTIARLEGERGGDAKLLVRLEADIAAERAKGERLEAELRARADKLEAERSRPWWRRLIG
jgi:hypothetical protein